MHKKYNIEIDQMTELSPEALPLLKNSALYGDDLRPVKITARNWTYTDFAMLWISMSICIPTYSLASGLITSGMNWWQAIFTIFAGNFIVLIPMVLIGAASTRYGIPYPVFCRSSFGTRGAHFPSLLRAGVACGWFGINCWIGGEFLYSFLFVTFPIIAAIPHAKYISFLIFWSVNIYLAYKGSEMIRRMNLFATPILTAAGFAVIFWALYEAGSVTALFSATAKITSGGAKASFAGLFLPSLNAMIAYWATLALNIGDFTRLARSQKDQIIGQSIGLPPTMAFYSLVGVMGTLGSVIAFGRGIWNPVELIESFNSPVLSLIGGMIVFIAVVTTNIPANVVAPANIFSNLSPQNISYQTGVMITGIAGILIMPWRLYADASGYIFGWLGTYGSFLGPLAGIYIADYYFIKKRNIDLYAIYCDKKDIYYYSGGVNYRAAAAYLISIIPFVADLAFKTFGGTVVDNSWIIGMFAGFLAYAAVMKKEKTDNSLKQERKQLQEPFKINLFISLFFVTLFF